MPKEERAKNAAARRKAETAAAIGKAVSEARAEEQAKAAEALDRIIAGGKRVAGAEEPGIFRARSETPGVADAPRQSDPKARDAQAARDETKIREQLSRISAMDPSITNIGDLMRMDTAKEFYSLVRKGNNFVDAYRLANYDRLSRSVQATAQQQALNKVGSKAYLTGTATRGAGAVTVPSAELALYRQLNPKMTESEIQAHYNRYLKK
jgi:hypothetical protein